METKIESKRTVQAKREQVFAALIDAGRLQDWFCDWAWTDPHPGGRYIFRWNSGYEVQGTFVKVDPPEKVLLVWQGSGEPGQTLVKWELEEEGAGTAVKVAHVGLGSGPRWKEVYAEAEKGWAEGLENLQSVLQEGVDLREARQPFLGVLLDGLTPERVRDEKIATETGIYVTGVVEGGAAETAGVKQGDVVVAIGKGEVVDFNSLVTALRACRAGDTVAVALVRGQERLSVQATLKQRESPEVPADPAVLVARIRENQARWNAAAAEATAGLSEEQAGQAPAEGEWSAKQVLTHLIVTEAFVQTTITNIAIGQRLEGNPDFSLAPDRNAVLLASEPTLAGLLARFARDQEETTLHLEHLSAGTLADRFRFRQIGRFVQQLGEHTDGHIGQIQRAVAAVRG